MPDELRAFQGVDLTLRSGDDALVNRLKQRRGELGRSAPKDETFYPLTSRLLVRDFMPGRRPQVWRKVWKFIVRLATVGAVVSLPGDFFNILQHFKLLQVEPPGAPILFEDYPPNPLPECLFTETFRAEAEPDFHLNWLDWAIGIGPAEESAYRRAEDRIWKTVAPGVPSSGEADLDSGERLAAQGLRLIRRKFYFDRHGYHALVVMGRLMDLQKSVESGCEIDRERGRLEQREASRRFTCESLHGVINTEVNGIMRVYNPDQCWVSYSYEINPQNWQIRFQGEYFIRNPEEESSDEMQWDM